MGPPSLALAREIGCLKRGAVMEPSLPQSCLDIADVCPTLWRTRACWHLVSSSPTAARARLGATMPGASLNVNAIRINED